MIPENWMWNIMISRCVACAINYDNSPDTTLILYVWILRVTLPRIRCKTRFVCLPSGKFQRRFAQVKAKARQKRNHLARNLRNWQHIDTGMRPEALHPHSMGMLFCTFDPYICRWGFYMIAAVFMQVVTGFLRQRALEGKHSNFCMLHRVRTTR